MPPKSSSRTPRKAAAKAAEQFAAKPGPRRGNGISPEAMLAELRQRLLEISDLGHANAVLGWDQATYMPKGGARARGRQKALLSKLAHERAVDPALGRLIDKLAAHAERLDPDSDDACLVRVARRNFERATKVPASFVTEFSELSSASYTAWTRARPENDFATMRPYLERTVELRRRLAELHAPWDHVCDPLIDGADEGMSTASVRKLFKELRRELVPIVKAITTQQPADAPEARFQHDTCLAGPFAEAPQLAFSTMAVERVGYDFARGRIDKTHHPFCTRFGDGDVRITTRVRENDLGDAFFSCLHEAGHALYEQGVDPALAGTPLGHGTSAGVHESQSRLWENVVGRGRDFWRYFYPRLQDAFPEPFRRVPPETFYRAINKVQRSLIRTDADEVTYNLHVMLRFDLEIDLLEGRLAVKDLPEAWNARMMSDLGIAPPDDRDGCLQDVHWYGGHLGGVFQGYTIGNVLAAQFYSAAVAAHPSIPDDIAAGRFATLHGWLRDHIYRHGRKFRPDDLVRRATGKPMSTGPYLAYLRAKYGELYALPA